MVTPNIVAPISDLAVPCGSIGGAPTIPAIAPAAFARICALIEFRPATSVTDAISVTSVPPT